MNDGVLRSISWRDMCPWTILFRVFRISISPAILLLALLGAFGSTAGWRVCESWFLADESLDDSSLQEFRAIVARWPGESLDTAPNGSRPEFTQFRAIDSSIAAIRNLPPVVLTTPIWRLFTPGLSWDVVFYYGGGGIWSVAIWSLFGGAITRMAIVNLGCEERVGCRESLEFARDKWVSYFGAPLLPLGGMLTVAVPMVVLGWVMRTNPGVVLAGLIWLMVILGGFIMALLAIGLLFGWPLMWSTISCEGTDAFDAISRSYAYTLQRPLHYACYVLMVGSLGIVGWLFVFAFSESVVWFCHWGVSWGTGYERFIRIPAALTPDESTSRVLQTGAVLINFFNGFIRGIPTAYAFSFFWTAATGIYLLLRRDTDQTEFDHVFFDDEDQQPFGLPDLTTDDSGVPGISDSNPVDTDE